MDMLEFENGRFPLSGALSGAASVLFFTWVHDLFISNIWGMLVPMLIAGIICGGLISWSYTVLVPPRLRGWLFYNFLYVSVFGLMAWLSVLIFEPITSMAELVNLNGPPDALIGEALPFTAVFTLVTALFITALYGFSGKKFAVILLTTVLLVLLLGLNVSVIGLVAIPRGSLFVIFEFFGLIVLLNIVFVLVFIVLERRALGLSIGEPGHLPSVTTVEE